MAGVNLHLGQGRGGPGPSLSGPPCAFPHHVMAVQRQPLFWGAAGIN